MVALLDTLLRLYMANTAELYAEQQGIAREMQDEFALARTSPPTMRTSQTLQEEITPVPLCNRRGEQQEIPSRRRSPASGDDHREPEEAEAVSADDNVTAGNTIESSRSSVRQPGDPLDQAQRTA